MSGLVLAARYLTIVPLPGRAPTGLDALGRAAVWFPVVGLGLGGALVVTEQVVGRLFPALLAALLTVTVWKLLTGGLHLDGLADCLDGLTGRDPTQRLAIMRDSRIGAFGALGLIVLMFLEIAAVTELPPAVRWRVLLVVPVVGRAMPALLARLLPPARPGGQGAAFAAGVSRSAAPLTLALATLAALAALGWAGVTAVAVAALAAVALARFLAGRLGGITGDVHGAAIEFAELTVLLTVSAWMHARLT